MRATILTVCAVLVSASASAGTFFEDGEQLFLQDRPEEARVLLEQALNADPNNETIYLYLGIVYEQLGRYDKAISIMQRGVPHATFYREMLLHNIGNNFFHRNEFRLAAEMYGQAITADGAFAPAYLNRANAYLQLSRFDEAVTDYTLYLRLEPSDPQRPEIEELIRRLTGHVADLEQQRLAEQQRQNALMDSVLNALKNASANTRNITAGSAEAEETYEELDLAD